MFGRKRKGKFADITDIKIDPFLTVVVTAEDIDNGTRASFSGCPISLAVRRKYGSRALAVATLNQMVIVEKWDGTQDKFNLPPEAQRFILSFDVFGRDKLGTRYNRPFTFTLEPLN